MATITHYHLKRVTPDGPFEVPLTSDPSGKTGVVLALESKTQFVHPTTNGRAFRDQGPIVASRVAGDARLVLFASRVVDNLDGNAETIENRAAKGQTHFRAQHIPSESETDYQAGYLWYAYGNQGTNGLSAQYDHHAYNLLLATVNTLFSDLATIQHDYTSSTGVKIVIGNFEYYWFVASQSGNPMSWDGTDLNTGGVKTTTFYSYLTGSNTTLQAIYDGAGGGQSGINALNQHLHAKHRIFQAQWCDMLRVRAGSNPLKVTNGDTIYCSVINVNGDLRLGNGQILDIRNYRDYGYDILKQVTNQFEGTFDAETCLGPSSVSYGGHTYNLSGHLYEHYDLLNHYHYILNGDIRMKISDYNALVGNTNTAAWNDKFIIASHRYYSLAISHAVRYRFFGLPEMIARFGKNLNTLPVLGMWEKMYEADYIALLPDTDDPNNTDWTDSNDWKGSIWMEWVEASAGSGNGQKHLITREYVFTRLWQEQILFSVTGTETMQGGTHEWWEADPTGVGTGDFAQNYTLGKYQYFNDLVITWAQQALDEINRYAHLFGTGKTVKWENIPFQWRRNSGNAWSGMFNDFDPARAAFYKLDGTKNPLPQIYEVRRGNEALYFVQCGQNKTGSRSRMDVRWYAFDGTALECTLSGPMPRLLYYNPALAVVPSGTYNTSVDDTWNTLQPIA